MSVIASCIASGDSNRNSIASCVDALLVQQQDADIWLTVCASSPWATRQPTDFRPPSPANDIARYRGFVRRLVAHCGGRVEYWRCDNEPSNTGLLWAGTAEEYVAHLTAFHAAVEDADPHANVVLGGCGYDVLSSPPGSEPREFLAHLVDAGRDAFDLFDVHLYGDPAAILSYVDDVRKMMRDNGYEKPVVAGEYAGPVRFEFPEVEPILQQTTMAAFTEPVSQSVDELTARAGQDGPERRATISLYEQAAELPDRLRMFLEGCPPELEARRHRFSRRQLVKRPRARALQRRRARRVLEPRSRGAPARWSRTR